MILYYILFSMEFNIFAENVTLRRLLPNILISFESGLLLRTIIKRWWALNRIYQFPLLSFFYYQRNSIY